LDDTFAGPSRTWPDRPRSTAWYADGVYRLEPREPGHFVALDAPLPSSFSTMSVWARLQKVGGPPGGGYGLIVADQGAADAYLTELAAAPDRVRRLCGWDWLVAALEALPAA
jgi:hypothetical protein